MRAIHFFAGVVLAPAFLLGLSFGARGQAGGLSGELARKDSVLFNAAFTTCDLKAVASVLTDDFVFYHDQGYTNPTTKETHAEFIGNIQKNFCGIQSTKMRRQIVRGTLEVSELSDREAIQSGVQRFYALTAGQPDQLVEESKFSRTWQKKGGDWKMARELDFLVNAHPGDNTATGGEVARAAGQTGAAGQTATAGQRYQPEPYAAEPKELYDTIVRMDSLYFDTYNNCRLETMAAMTSDTLEFYHDRGGLMTSKTAYLESIKKNICGKVTRELMPGSIEVYPIHGWGAVEIGYHRFHNNQEPDAPWRASKFIILWHKKGDKWEVARVVSLH
jgi:ketosteroid isomerase-like protein